MVRTVKDVEARELKGYSLSSMEGVIWSLIPELDMHLSSGESSSLVDGVTSGHLRSPFELTAAALVKMDYAPARMLGDAQLSDEQ